MADWGLIAIRFALYADLMLLVGLAAFPLYSLTLEERETQGPIHQFARWLRWVAPGGLVVSTFGFAALSASMFGVGMFELDREMSVIMVTDTAVGIAWQWQLAALLAASLATLRVTRNPTTSLVPVALAGSVALATLVWSGHAEATEGIAGILHRLSDSIHIIAAAVWLGAIIGFHILLTPTQKEPPASWLCLVHRALDQFAVIGTICVLLIVVTGLINGQMIVGIANLAPAMTAPYGQLALRKLILFAAMLILAAHNRWRLSPNLARSLESGEEDQAVAALKLSLWRETLAGGGILGVVAVLGMLQPFE